MGQALNGLETAEQYDLTVRQAIDVPLEWIVSPDGEVLARGKQLLRLLAAQLQRLPCDATFQVRQPEAVRAKNHMVAMDHRCVSI